ncbi:MAG: HAD-IB family hydrolase [Candidatus Nanoarchaeia archaeon]|nr:HAD-IB family hydrolase [Candidatus Nanoarchaeia archaeon]
MEIGVFFDLDDTIIKGNSGLRYIRFLYENRILKAHKSAILPSLKLAYNYLKGDYKKAVDQADNLMALAFKGANKKETVRAAEFFVLNDVKNLKNPILERINWHKNQGHKLILLSASPDEVVQKFGKFLKFDYIRGSLFKLKNNIYTGELIIPSMIGKERAIVAKKIAKKLNIDLKQSYSYGNCINDLEVLELVGNPFAVNPNKYLVSIARKKGFRII